MLFNDEYENFEETLVITGKIWLDDERDWLEFIKKVEDLASNYNYRCFTGVNKVLL